MNSKNIKEKGFVRMSVTPSNIIMISLFFFLATPSFLYSALAAVINGTSGNDTLNGTPQADTIRGYRGNDIINGYGGNDQLYGGPGGDNVNGGIGNDNIYGYRGNDRLNGGDGDDKIYDRVAGDSHNVMRGGAGNDGIFLGISTGEYNNFLNFVYGGGGFDSIEVVNTRVEIYAGSGGDSISCRGGIFCLSYGEDGNDKIYIDAQEIESGAFGGNGDDHLISEAGSYLDGGSGNDLLEGIVGDTEYFGGPGADFFKCSPGRGDEVIDYNAAEGDKLSRDCEHWQQ